MAQLEGFADLQRQLTALGAAAGGRVLRSALMSASLPALRNIQAAAPTGSKAHRTYMGRLVAPGFLKRNIRRKSLLSRDRSHARVLIGPASEAFYAQFIEFGKAGYSASPFIIPAFRNSQDQMIAKLRDRLGILIQRAARKK